MINEAIESFDTPSEDIINPYIFDIEKELEESNKRAFEKDEERNMLRKQIEAMF